MPTRQDRSPSERAEEKIASDRLMTLAEVAAKLDVSPSTVHRLPLPSIRVGHVLRFDPRDVCRLIEASKEAVAHPNGSAAMEGAQA